MRTYWIVVPMLLAAPVAVAAQTTRIAADSAWVHGDRKSARSLYIACIEEGDADPVALFRLGLIAGWNGDPHESIRWFDRILADHPLDRDVRVARARAVAATGDLDAAILTIDSIMAGWPDDVGAIVARARFADWMRDGQLAERLWHHALDLDPDNVEAVTGLSGSLRRTGRIVEARRALAAARAAAPTDPDVRAASDYIERELRPGINSMATVEDDSDGNAIRTLSAGAAIHVGERVRMRTDAWTRRASLDLATSPVTARGALLGLAVAAPGGWTFATSIGATSTDGSGDGATAAVSASATSPADRDAVMSITGSRTPLDYTLPLVRNRVVATDARASLTVRRGRNWDFDLDAGVAVFEARRTGQDSRRISIRSDVRRRLNDRFAFVAGAHAFGFDRDIDGGFFDPARYGLLDIGLAWNLDYRHWKLTADVAPGVQHIGSNGQTGGAMRAAASLTWQIRPGRQFSVRGTFANTGLQQLNGDAGNGYRYTSLAAALRWWF